MADPMWIKKAIVLTAFLAIPAMVLLARAKKRWRDYSTASFTQVMPFWFGSAVVVSYFFWFLNVTFEYSVTFMIAWPLLGIALSLMACLLAMIGSGQQKWSLAGANALLLLLAIASIVAPN